MDVRSSFPHKKCVCVFTPRLLSHSPKENGANEAQGVEIWGYKTCMVENGRSKVTQILIRTLKFILGPFTLSPINDQIRDPH